MDPSTLADFSFNQEWLIENILNNEFLWAAVSGAILIALRNLPQQIFNRILRLLSFSISVHSEDSTSFITLQVWLLNQGFQKWTNRFLIKQSYRYNEEDSHQIPNIFYIGDDCSWIIGPDEGSHFGFYGNIPMIITKATESGSIAEIRHETITVRFFTPFKSALSRDILPQMRTFITSSKDALSIRNYSGHSSSYIVRDYIQPETLIYPNQIYDKLITDLTKFYASQQEYQRLGIHWHRGYGFFGSPGMGKTSMILALASHFRMTIHKFSIRNLTLTQLLNYLSDIKSGLVIFEDIDILNITQKRIVDQNKPPLAMGESSNNSRPDMSIELNDLLGILDGLDTPEGIIFILTSNYPQVLDDALLRPGRIDLQIDFTLLQLPEVKLIVKKFYQQIPNLSGDIEISPAELQNLCRNAESFEGTVAALLEQFPGLSHN